MAKGNRIGFIADDTETNHKEVEYYKKLFNMEAVPCFADTFDHFEKGFVEIQGKVDMLVFYNYVAIRGWDDAAALDFIEKNTKVPTGTMQDGPMKYCLIGFLKVAQEQGIWAANAALKILDAESAGKIPVARNKEGRLVVNARLAQKSKMQIPMNLVEAAAQVIEN